MAVEGTGFMQSSFRPSTSDGGTRFGVAQEAARGPLLRNREDLLGACLRRTLISGTHQRVQPMPGPHKMKQPIDIMAGSFCRLSIGASGASSAHLPTFFCSSSIFPQARVAGLSPLNPGNETLAPVPMNIRQPCPLYTPKESKQLLVIYWKPPPGPSRQNLALFPSPQDYRLKTARQSPSLSLASSLVCKL